MQHTDGQTTVAQVLPLEDDARLRIHRNSVLGRCAKKMASAAIFIGIFLIVAFFPLKIKQCNSFRIFNPTLTEEK